MDLANKWIWLSLFAQKNTYWGLEHVQAVENAIDVEFFVNHNLAFLDYLWVLAVFIAFAKLSFPAWFLNLGECLKLWAISLKQASDVFLWELSLIDRARQNSKDHGDQHTLPSQVSHHHLECLDLFAWLIHHIWVEEVRTKDNPTLKLLGSAFQRVSQLVALWTPRLSLLDLESHEVLTILQKVDAVVFDVY